MFGWPRKSRSTSGFAGAQRYWLLGFTDFRNFFIPYVSEVKESIFHSFTKATMFGWPQKSRSTSGFTGAWVYWLLGLMDFRNFFISHIFEVKESIVNRFTESPCLGDLENLGQLPVNPWASHYLTLFRFHAFRRDLPCTQNRYHYHVYQMYSTH